MPTKRIFALSAMVFVGGTLVLGGLKLWSAKTLATTDTGFAHGVAEIGSLL